MWRKLLELAIARLLGGAAWIEVQCVVETLLRADLPGAEKRRLAVQQLRQIGLDCATWLLHAAIEVAYGRVNPPPAS